MALCVQASNGAIEQDIVVSYTCARHDPRTCHSHREAEYSKISATLQLQVL